MAIAGIDINNIKIKIILLFNRFIIINNIFTPDLTLGGRFIIKSMDIFYQIRYGIGSGFKRFFFIPAEPRNKNIFHSSVQSGGNPANNVANKNPC